MSNTVPEGWGSLELGKIFKLLKGSIVPQDNPAERLEYYSIPVFDQTGSSTLVFGAEIESNKTLISEPSILVSKLNPRKPRVQVVKKASQYRQCASTEFMAYAPKVAEVDLSFFRYYFVSEYFSSRLQLVATGSTNSHVRVTPNETLKWRVPHPPLPEQQKIAAILSSVDDIIEKTRAQIDKLKDLKTGMMQELLTKGIGSGGVPHTEFKDSPVGRVPASWKIVELGEIAKQVKPGPFGSSLTKAMYVEKGYKVYGQEQVISGDFRTGDYYIDEAKYDELAAFKVASGDILISLVGTFGQVAVVPATFEAGIINPRLLKIRFPSNIMDSQFIAQQLRSEFVLNQLKQLQQGGTMGVLSATTVKPVKLIVPPLDEQKMIGNSVHAIDMAVSTKLEKLRSTQNLKKALMQDLLTGKVRVKVDQKESAVA